MLHMNSNWQERIFDCLRRVNHQLHGRDKLPEQASNMLNNMEFCLCSGDGLTGETAFKTGNETVMDRTLGMLGLCDSVRNVHQEECLSIVSLTDNQYGIAELYFKCLS